MNYLDACFDDLVSQLKSLGYTVFLKENMESGFHYGWVSNGSDFLYFQLTHGEGAHFSIETKRYGIGLENKEIPMFTDSGINPRFLDWAFEALVNCPLPLYDSFEEYWNVRNKRFGWTYIEA